MAERSKAPDSREILPLEQRLSVLVLSEGVGSNPTSDKYFFLFHSGSREYVIFEIHAANFEN
jgi:hypothetical protein